MLFDMFLTVVFRILTLLRHLLVIIINISGVDRL